MVHKTHPYINFYHLADSKVISNQPANLRQKKPNLGESWADKKQTIMENQIALLDEPSLGFDG